MENNKNNSIEVFVVIRIHEYADYAIEAYYTSTSISRIFDNYDDACDFVCKNPPKLTEFEEQNYGGKVHYIIEGYMLNGDGTMMHCSEF